MTDTPAAVSALAAALRHLEGTLADVPLRTLTELTPEEHAERVLAALLADPAAARAVAGALVPAAVAWLRGLNEKLIGENHDLRAENARLRAVASAAREMFRRAGVICPDCGEVDPHSPDDGSCAALPLRTALAALDAAGEAGR